MYRRIELITKFGKCTYKTGICGIMLFDEIIDAWIDDLPAPKKRLRKNCRFYFTELGWNIIGRNIIAACMKARQEYRVLCVKERSVEVFYKDDLQVAVRPR